MLAEERITEYLDQLKSSAPAPGGGAAAALSGAQGAALVMMVANLTVGKKKYAEYEELNRNVLEEAEHLLQGLIRGIDDDKGAFEVVSRAYALPKETPEEKAARKDAIAEASVHAAEVPLQAMRAACRALELNRELLGKSNRNLVSDLYVAALNLNACVQAAKYNVLANTPYFRDQEEAARLEDEARQLSDVSAKLSAEILADGDAR